MKGLIWLTRESVPYEVEGDTLQNILDKADTDKANWVCVNGVLAGKLIDGKWAKVS